MPVSTSIPIQRLSQSEFGSLSYGVMEHVFAIHKEFGPFCDEKIYKRELAQRMAGVSLEVAVDVTFRSFAKRYFLDVVVGAGGVFEFKCVDDLHPRHRAQLLHYRCCSIWVTRNSSTCEPAKCSTNSSTPR